MPSFLNPLVSTEFFAPAASWLAVSGLGRLDRVQFGTVGVAMSSAPAAGLAANQIAVDSAKASPAGKETRLISSSLFGARKRVPRRYLGRTIEQSIEGSCTNDNDALHDQLQIKIEAKNVDQIECYNQNQHPGERSDDAAAPALKGCAAK